MTDNEILTLAIAGYGAVVATVVLVWDIYKWKTSGPKLTMRVATGMKTVNVPEYEGMTLVAVTVENRGDRAATITNMGFEAWPNRVARWVRVARKEAGIVPQPSTTQRLPFKLEPGAQWMGFVDQEELTKTLRDDYVQFFVSHTHSDKPLRRHTTLKD